MVYIRILGPWPIKCHTSIALFGWNHGKTHEPWFKGICSYCKPNSDQRINAWFFHGSSFLLWSSQFHGFCSQNLNIVRMKLKALFWRNSTILSPQKIYKGCEMHYNWTLKKNPMNMSFNHVRDSLRLLGILIPPFDS